jgi:hypothetical protein
MIAPVERVQPRLSRLRFVGIIAITIITAITVAFAIMQPHVITTSLVC